MIFAAKAKEKYHELVLDMEKFVPQVEKAFGKKVEISIVKHYVIDLWEVRIYDHGKTLEENEEAYNDFLQWWYIDGAEAYPEYLVLLDSTVNLEVESDSSSIESTLP